MKVGTQLAVTTLPYLAAIGLVCTLIAVRSPPQLFLQNQRPEIRMAHRALNASLTAQIAASLLANAAFLLIGAGGIALMTRRYVTRPLADLSRRITALGISEEEVRAANDGKVVFSSDEFRNIDLQLAGMQRCLLQESDRRLQLERRSLNADKHAAIATLASSFAHEIGNPLGVIRGRSEMLLSSGNIEPSELRENLEVIVAEIDCITRMVTLLLHLGQRRPAIRVASDLRAIAEHSIQLLEPEAVRRGVAMIRNLGSKPLMVDCDPDQLEQVFLNLETNALDAMTPGGGMLQVHSFVDEVDGKVGLSFEDSGPGVPAAIRNRIFDPVFTTRNPGRGDGMGLALSHSIITDHNGELILEPRAHGTCFTITLPASRSVERLSR
jgi:signal transduction histidine kinase